MARPCLDDLGKWFAEYVRGKGCECFCCWDCRRECIILAIAAMLDTKFWDRIITFVNDMKDRAANAVRALRARMEL